MHQISKELIKFKVITELKIITHVYLYSQDLLSPYIFRVANSQSLNKMRWEGFELLSDELCVQALCCFVTLLRRAVLEHTYIKAN